MAVRILGASRSKRGTAKKIKDVSTSNTKRGKGGRTFQNGRTVGQRDVCIHSTREGGFDVRVLSVNSE